MTLTEAAVSSVGVAACAFCRRRLADEYYFTCRRCDASYCYIHMSRHQSVRCARQVELNGRALSAPLGQRQGEEGSLLGRISVSS